MPRTFARQSARTMPIAWGMVLGILLTATSGCAFNSRFLKSFAGKQECALPPDPTIAEIVGHINANVAKVRSWRSTNVSITAKGAGPIPVRLSGVIDVEQPRNFHVMLSTFGTEQADLGSNSERFWFWGRDSNAVVTARHDQIHQVRQLPFEPQWVMEVLGVIPIDEDHLTMQRQGAKGHLVSLVAERTAPDGRRVRRVTLVDSCRGHVVSHALYDSSDRLIARAELNDYRTVSSDGLLLPHLISFDWPQAGLGLTMAIRDLEANPTDIPINAWNMPKPSGCPVVNLAQLPAHFTQQNSEAAGRIRLGADRSGRARLDAPTNRRGSIQQASDEADWEPPTVRDGNERSRRSNSSPWAPPFDRSPQRRNWLQRMFGL